MPASVTLLETKRFGDERGWFAETYSEARLRGFGISCTFVQDNQSFSAAGGTVRGIHFQRPPHAQAKLVRCLKGAILDYAVDLRLGSPTFGNFLVAELSAENGRQLFIPIGFGHAFVTLTPDCEITYKVSDIYSPADDGGIAWDDPDVAIPWSLPASGPVLSDKDRSLGSLASFQSPFIYDGQPMPAVITAQA